MWLKAKAANDLFANAVSALIGRNRGTDLDTICVLDIVAVQLLKAQSAGRHRLK